VVLAIHKKGGIKMIIGFDKSGQVPLRAGDICNFTIEGKPHQGMITYDEGLYAFTFEMLDNNFPVVKMDIADQSSIVRICNIADTSKDDETYAGYHKLIENEPQSFEALLSEMLKKAEADYKKPYQDDSEQSMSLGKSLVLEDVIQAYSEASL
jgi:flagellar hook-basal body complex protein FliE